MSVGAMSVGGNADYGLLTQVLQRLQAVEDQGGILGLALAAAHEEFVNGTDKAGQTLEATETSLQAAIDEVRNDSEQQIASLQREIAQINKTIQALIVCLFGVLLPLCLSWISWRLL